MHRDDGLCPRCGIRPRLHETRPYCRPCKLEYMREKRGSRPREKRERNWTARGMECSKAPPPPPGFAERDLTTARPWA